MTGDELFHKPASEWTDAELQAGVRMVIDTRNAASTAGDLLRADAWNSVLLVLANERSTRAQLYQETGETVEYDAREDDASIRPISELLRLEDSDPSYRPDVSDVFAETQAEIPPVRRPPRVEIYTDGACKRNPDGPGGWGVVLCSGQHRKELHGGSPRTTNNRMELTAVIEALNALKGPSEIELFTDSEYVRKGITEWIHTWKKRGWMTADKRPVKNSDLWRALDEAAGRHDIQWRWVRGHDGNPGNERADALANLGAAEHA